MVYLYKVVKGIKILCWFEDIVICRYWENIFGSGIFEKE